MEFEKVIKERVSTRKFTEEPVSKKTMDKILEAGRIAPTAKNRQPQKIYVIETPEGLAKVDKVTKCRFGAPTCLLICSDKSIAWERDDYSSFEMDATIVATHMMLEATNLGIGNVWVRLFNKDDVIKEFNLPENIIPVCFLQMGYQEKDYEPSPLHYERKDISELVEYL